MLVNIFVFTSINYLLIILFIYLLFNYENSILHLNLDE